MPLIRYLHIFIIVMGLTNSLFAFGQDQTAADGQTIDFEGDLFGRSSVRFVGQSNVVVVVPAGSSAEILQTKRMPSGSYGVQVKITKVNGSRGSDTASVGQTVWVYDSKKHPWLHFPDKIKSEFYSKSENSENIPTSPTSSSCNFSSKGNFSPVAERNHRDLQSISDNAVGSDDAPSLSFKNLVKPGENGETNMDATIEKYSTSDKVQRMIDYVKDNLHHEEHPLCYRSVKEALVLGHPNGGTADSILHSYPPGPGAKDGVEDLENQGMTNLLNNPKYRSMATNPDLIPKGAVVVYDTGAPRSYGMMHYGHIEIKGGEGHSHYYSFFDGETDFMERYSKAEHDAREDGYPYHIVGVMIKGD